MAGQQRRPGPQSGRGDTTGRQREVLQAEHEDAVNARRDELGLITAGKRQIKDEGVIDLTGDQPRLEGSDELIDAAAREPGVKAEEKTDPDGQRIGSSTAAYEVRELPEEQPRAAVQRNEVQTPDMLEKPVVIRALFDLEDVTIGYGNTFTFREGYRYKVPRWVAAHLEEKGLALVLSLTAA